MAKTISKEDVHRSMNIDRAISRNNANTSAQKSDPNSYNPNRNYDAENERENKKLREYHQNIIFHRQTTDSNQ